MDANALVKALVSERVRFVELVRRRVWNDADAEDIVQRALLRAATHAESIEDPARARAWFYRILRRAVLDHHRARPEDPMRHRADVELGDSASHASKPEGTACGCSLKLLAALRPAYADVIRRIDVNGEDVAAAAKELGVSTGNLHVRLHRARRILRDGVQHYCGVTSHRPCLDCCCDSHERCGSSGHTQKEMQDHP